MGLYHAPQIMLKVSTRLVFNLHKPPKDGYLVYAHSSLRLLTLRSM